MRHVCPVRGRLTHVFLKTKTNTSIDRITVLIVCRLELASSMRFPMENRPRGLPGRISVASRGPFCVSRCKRCSIGTVSKNDKQKILQNSEGREASHTPRLTCGTRIHHRRSAGSGIYPGNRLYFVVWRIRHRLFARRFNAPGTARDSNPHAKG